MALSAHKNGTIYTSPSLYKGDGIYDNVKLPPVASMTLRFKFSDPTYSPVVAGVGTSGTWAQVKSSPNIWDWTNTNTQWNNVFSDAFVDENNDVKIIDAGNTENLVSLYWAFRNCKAIKYICLFDTKNVTNMYLAFTECQLKKIPNFNTSKVSNFSYCFSVNKELKEIPLLDTGKASNVQYMFRNCFNVKSGALALYQQMSTQTTPPSLHTGCFMDCGRDTTTGTAELAQIPASWGGTGPEPE